MTAVGSARLTGHDLMAMFPAQSPLSMCPSPSPCRVFNAQERAFFAQGGPSRGVSSTLTSARVAHMEPGPSQADVEIIDMSPMS